MNKKNRRLVDKLIIYICRKEGFRAIVLDVIVLQITRKAQSEGDLVVIKACFRHSTKTNE